MRRNTVAGLTLRRLAAPERLPLRATARKWRRLSQCIGCISANLFGKTDYGSLDSLGPTKMSLKRSELILSGVHRRFPGEIDDAKYHTMGSRARDSASDCGRICLR